MQYPDCVTRLSSATLTTETFFEHVLSRKPRIAVFDCDGTLWSSNSGLDFMYWEIKQGLLAKQVSEDLLKRFKLYEAGEVSEVDMCGEMVSCHANLRLDDIGAAVKRFAIEHIAPNIFPAMLELVKCLSEQGCDLWAVSSTASWVVREGLIPFGIRPEQVLGVEVATRGDVVTPELIAVPTDELKAAALVKAGLPHPDAVFGNSIHDLAMLEIARASYAVNPNDDLRAIAETRNWPIYQPDI